MADSSMVLSQFQGVAVANFRTPSIVDPLAVEAINKQLLELVEEQAQKKIVLDFDVVRMMSSQMLGVLISLQKKCREIRGRVILCGVRPEVMKIFQITRLTKMFEFAENEAQGFKKLGF